MLVISMDDDTFHLLANPYHIKKRKNLYIQPTIDDEIVRLIQKKFPRLKILEEDYSIFIVKIENLLIDIIIENHLKTIINERLLPSIYQESIEK
tara:strand:- start:347 stop:628 length:282 start_codon:yes stop_codon:yes gene_type:complete